MKKTVLLLTLFFSITLMQAQTWTWDHAPKAGENAMFHITDVPDDGPYHIVYYSFNGTQVKVGDVGMLRSDAKNKINASIAINDQASWVSLALKNENNQIKSSHQVKVQNDKALPGAAMIEEALASSTYARMMDIKAEDAVVVTLYRDGVKANPKWLDESDVFRGYYTVAKRTNAEQDLAALKTHLTTLTAKSNEGILIQGIRAAKDMADSTLQADLRKKLDKTYPKSMLAQEELFATFRSDTTLEGKMKIRDQFKSKYPVTKDNTRLIDQMTSTIAQEYAKKEDWSKVKSYVDQMIDPQAKASVCNNYAWTLSGESIEAPAPHLAIAGELSAKSLQLLTTDLAVPMGLTKTEWARFLDNYKGMYGDTYALILFKQGKYAEAIDHQLFSVQNSNFESGDMNERYAVYLEKAGRTAELEMFMDKIIVMGAATEVVMNIHRNHWTQSANQIKLYDSYVHQLEMKAKALRIEKIKKSWQETDALPFTLKDLDGHEVSLSDYKGKTVIIDFWATWCGPCKASFPGMKKAVELYSTSENVHFLFVDTWENGENIQDRVAKFISDNEYPFHVLMDAENKVVSNFKVEGIPTKFIIGPDQKIRFKAVGYNGNNEELVEELKTMIELVQENAVMEKS